MPEKVNKIKYAKWIYQWRSFLLVKGLHSAMEGIPNLPRKHTAVVISSNATLARVKLINTAITINDLAVANLRLAVEKSDRAVAVLQRGI